jgi:hypothetical protein
LINLWFWEEAEGDPGNQNNFIPDFRSTTSASSLSDRCAGKEKVNLFPIQAPGLVVSGTYWETPRKFVPDTLTGVPEECGKEAAKNSLTPQAL